MICKQRQILFASIFIFTTPIFAQPTLKSKLIFEDYFDSFSTYNWKKASHTFENSLAHFSAKNVSTQDGRLQLHLKPQLLKDKLYSGAEIRTKDSFKYGKFVARLKPAKGEGVISGFFLYNPKGGSHEEIDIEFAGLNSNLVHFNHWVNKIEKPFSVPLNFDAGNTYHEYSILWLPDYICWEIDGKEVYRTTENIPHSRMKLMFNLWASKTNSWAGEFSPSVLPVSFEIDYIKIFSYQ